MGRARHIHQHQCQEVILNPKDLRYTKGHTWVKRADAEATIGITNYAQEQLGSVLFLDISQVGELVKQGQPCGTVESDKATSEVMCPVSGKVVAVNQKALDAPELVNQDPYGQGWLLRIEMSDSKELDVLMTVEAFEAYTAGS
ncbi:MAG: glycine cleavage system protein GcvH [Chloroflexi bacterium]|nr:glycine cleavage system protein GcvH [Chloroflexota bacterium]